MGKTKNEVLCTESALPDELFSLLATVNSADQKNLA